MIEIRTMSITDYSDVIHLWQCSEGLSIRDADSEQNIGVYLTKNPGLSFVAIENDQLIGTVLAGTDGRRGYLQHLTIKPSCQGKGIGRQLVTKVIDALAQNGIDKTHLFVHDTNENAQKFYKKLGFFIRDEVRMFSFNNSSNPNT